MDGKRLTVGDTILYIGYGEEILQEPRPVQIVDIHRQGADGTILTTDLPPKPEYPHHYSCRASVVRRAWQA
jgi:hypothetical protein